MLTTVSQIFAVLALVFLVAHIVWPHVPLWICVLMLAVFALVQAFALAR